MISDTFIRTVHHRTVLVLFYLDGWLDRRAAQVDEYMEGTVFLRMLVSGFAYGWAYFIKGFLIIISFILMLLHVILHFLARLFQIGEQAEWKNKAGEICLLIAFLLTMLLLLLVLVIHISDLIIPIIMGFMVFAYSHIEQKILNEGKEALIKS